jgi:hypothetical protein
MVLTIGFMTELNGTVFSPAYDARGDRGLSFSGEKPQDAVPTCELRRTLPLKTVPFMTEFSLDL